MCTSLRAREPVSSASRRQTPARTISTPREREVLQLLTEGKTNKEIGACSGWPPRLPKHTGHTS